MSVDIGLSHPLAAPLWAALTSYDVDRLASLLSPSFRRWLNVSDEEITREEFLRLAAGEHAVVTESAFGLRREIRTEDGFVLLFDLAGRISGDDSWHTPVCLIVTASQTQIERIDEFVDSRPLLPLIRALRPAASPAGPAGTDAPPRSGP